MKCQYLHDCDKLTNRKNENNVIFDGTEQHWPCNIAA